MQLLSIDFFKYVENDKGNLNRAEVNWERIAKIFDFYPFPNVERPKPVSALQKIFDNMNDPLKTVGFSSPE